MARRYGCALALVVCTPLFMLLFVAETLGDCLPEFDCHKDMVRNVIVPTVVAGISISLLVRAAFWAWDRFRQR